MLKTWKRPGVSRFSRPLLLYSPIAIMLFVFLFPIIWLVINSFKSYSDVINPSSFLFRPTLGNYELVFLERPFALYFLNSVIVSTSATVLSLSLGSMTAYVLCRSRWRGKTHLLILILFCQMFPAMTSVLPIFLMIRNLGLLDTYAGVIMPITSFNLPLVVWLMRGFFMGIPLELEESAFIDGCSAFQALVKVVLPLAVPGIGAAGILVFVMSWNEFVFPLILTGSATKTAPVALAAFLADNRIGWGEMSVLGAVTILPMIVCVALFGKYLIRGLTWGAVKG